MYGGGTWGGAGGCLSREARVITVAKVVRNFNKSKKVFGEVCPGFFWVSRNYCVLLQWLVSPVDGGRCSVDGCYRRTECVGEFFGSLRILPYLCRVIIKKGIIMKREDILKVIKQLACSQGSYGRLLRELESNPEGADEFFAECERQNFKNAVDFIMWLEG